MPQDWFDSNAAPAQATGEDWFASQAQQQPMASHGQPAEKRGFLSHIAPYVNPMNIIKGLSPIVTNPHGMGVGVGEVAFNALTGPARASWPGLKASLSEGDAAGVTRHAVGSIPLVGPAAVNLSDAMDRQDYGGAAGEAAGVGLSLYGPQAVARGAGMAGEAIASRVLNTPRDVARIALQERVMPGIVRSGTSKLDARIAEAEAPALDTLSGPAGRTMIPGHLTGGPNAKAAFDASMMRAAPEEAAAAGRNVANQVINNPRLTTPTAERVFDVAMGSRAAERGTGTLRGLHERAIASDMMGKVADAVPEVAPTVGRLNNLARVEEAYAAQPGHVINAEGLPIFSNLRIAASLANRVAGPSAQGLHNVGRLSPVGQTAGLSQLSQIRSALADPNLSPEERLILERERQRLESVP